MSLVGAFVLPRGLLNVPLQSTRPIKTKPMLCRVNTPSLLTCFKSGLSFDGMTITFPIFVNALRAAFPEPENFHRPDGRLDIYTRKNDKEPQTLVWTKINGEPRDIPDELNEWGVYVWAANGSYMAPIYWVSKAERTGDADVRMAMIVAQLNDLLRVRGQT